MICLMFKLSFWSILEVLFAKPIVARGLVHHYFPNILSSNQVAVLEADMSLEEVKRVMWVCGTNKSLGPNGFSFDFIRQFWYLVGVDFVVVGLEVFRSSSFP